MNGPNWQEKKRPKKYLTNNDALALPERSEELPPPLQNLMKSFSKNIFSEKNKKNIFFYPKQIFVVLKKWLNSASKQFNMQKKKERGKTFFRKCFEKKFFGKKYFSKKIFDKTLFFYKKLFFCWKRIIAPPPPLRL